MAATERVTVTLPGEMLERIDHLERNRSRFIAEAVERELQRRRREGLLQSLRHPHLESAEMAEAGFTDWQEGLPKDDHDLVNQEAGKAVRWVEGKGWVEE